GSPLSALHFIGLQVHDQDGKQVAESADIGVELALLPLFDREVRVTNLSARRLGVSALVKEDGSVDLAGLIKKDKEPSAEPSNWKVSIENAALIDGHLSLAVGGEQYVAEHLHLRASAHIGPENTRAAVDNLSVALSGGKIALPGPIRLQVER